MVEAMRIDAMSLIAAQSAPRPIQTQAPPRPAQPADNSLFEPLIFPQAKAEVAASKPQAVSPQTLPRRPGALIDITV
jgi:hypothetical protein